MEYNIKVNEEELRMISNTLEFASRFFSGQIGHTYLPNNIKYDIFSFSKDNIDETNKRIEEFDKVGNHLKSIMYPELSKHDNGSYGISKIKYSTELYDIYKKINVEIKSNYDKNYAPLFENWNVDSSYMKFSKIKDINFIYRNKKPNKNIFKKLKENFYLLDYLKVKTKIEKNILSDLYWNTKNELLIKSKYNYNSLIYCRIKNRGFVGIKFVKIPK